MRKTLLASLFLLLCTALVAGTISKKQAMQKAQTLLGNSTDLQLVSMGDGVQPAYYVFNDAQKGRGFVIISGEETGDEILGFSENGTFDPQNMPPALAWWLQCYQFQTEQIRNGQARPHRAPVVREAIAPLVKTQWNQEEPYNGMLPFNPLKGNTIRYKHTGCVATAMAQLLKYWASEKGAAAIPGYSYESQYVGSGDNLVTVVTTLEALPETTFNYDVMKEVYTVADTATEAGKEVAKLMRYCGQAANMTYYDSESSAPTSGKYFATYFGFNPYYQELKRADYSSAAWDEIIYGELTAKRPVIYSGAKVTDSGHAFICDGYKDGLYHINWGWGGHYDGYFKLSEANSYGTGTGAGNGLDGYSFDQEAVVRIQPEATEPVSEESVLMTIAGLSVNGNVLPRISSNADFTVPVKFTVWNYTGTTHTFELGIGLYEGEKLLKVFTFYTAELGDKQGFKDREMSLEFGSNLSDGEYTLKAICRTAGATEWHEDFGSATRYIKLVINGTSLSAEATKEELLVNSVDYEGLLKVGSTLTATVNITNTGDMNYSTLYMFVNGNLVTGAGVNISHGETDNVLLHFQATSAGTFPVKLCTNPDGTGEIWSSTLTIETRKDPTTLAVGQVQVTNKIADYELGSYVIQGTTMEVSVAIHNTDTQAFNDIVVVQLWKNYLDDVNSYDVDRISNKEVVIAPGETKDVNIKIDNLDIGHRYAVRLYVFGASGNLVKIGQTPGYPVVEDPAGIQHVTVDNGMTEGTPVYDLSGRHVGTVGEPLPKGVVVVKGKKVLMK